MFRERRVIVGGVITLAFIGLYVLFTPDIYLSKKRSPDEDIKRLNRVINQETPEEVDEILDKLEEATIAFNTPKKIPLGNVDRITLILSKKKTKAVLKAQFSENKTVKVVTINITPYVKAALTGEGFKIHPITTETQLVSSRVDTIWIWQIMPQRKGKLQLFLTITALIEGGTYQRSLETFEETISVNVPFSETVADFIKANWHWLWVTILVPIAAWVWRKVKKTKL